MLHASKTGVDRFHYYPRPKCYESKHHLTKTLLTRHACICFRCTFYSPTEHAPLVARRRTSGRGTRPCYIPRRRSHGRPLRTHRGSTGGRGFHGKRWGPAPGTPGTRLPHQHLLHQRFVFFFKKKDKCLMHANIKYLLCIYLFYMRRLSCW